VRAETISDIKREIRKEARERVRTLDEGTLRNLSASAVHCLLKRPEWKSAKRVLGYLALKDELDLSSLLKAALAEGKTVSLPRFVPETGTYQAATLPEKEGFATLSFGRFGILEPGPSAPMLPLNQLDFVLVPGVAFDASGKRLGRGKGFYDRLLAETNNTCIKCGVALEEQIVAAIPAEAHDIAMNFILTPSRWIICKEGSA
jgi:5-formyltetrahydrofolate cyclo-ligase